MSVLHDIFARTSAWLGPALANHMWQATLFAALVLVATLLLQRRAPARVRFALWLAAAAKFALPRAFFALLVDVADVRTLLSPPAGETMPFVFRLAEPIQIRPDAADIVVSVSGAPGRSEIFCALGCAGRPWTPPARRSSSPRSWTASRSQSSVSSTTSL